MKIFLFNLLFFSLAQTAFGQVLGKITTVDGQPIPFANVLLLKSSDSSLVKAGLTNEEGVYQLENTLPGKYMIRLSSIGYQTWSSPVFELTASLKSKDFGAQVMLEDKKQLGEVVVRAEKPLYQQKPEGTVINVESSVLTKGSTVAEVLERSPGVIIDQQNNGISLNGKSGVAVMLNGKLMRMSGEQVINLLKGMSANDIEKIELLTAPPAGYDAEGSSGIINIVLKKNRKRGTNGTVSVTTGYGWGEKATATINLAHNTKRVNIYGNYSYLRDRTYSNMFITSSQNMPQFGGQLDVVFWDTANATQNNHDVTAGVDFTINPKTVIGGSINLNLSSRTAANNTHSNYTVLPDSLLFYNGYINGTNHWKNIISSFYAEKNIGQGKKINLNLDYLRFTNNSPTDVESFFVNKDGIQTGNNDSLFAPRQKGFANTTIQVGVVKIDYSSQLSKKLKLETGAKASFMRSVSSSRIESLVNNEWVSRPETVDDLLMKESIGAVYASVSAQLNTRTTLIAGARYEYALTNMLHPVTKENLVNRRRGVLFPNLLFSTRLNDYAELQLSFSKRISRPSYNDLASFVRYSDPTAIYTGNPLLKPTITHALKLGYNYRSYALTLLFSRDDYPIARYQITESPQKNLLYVSPQNITWQNNITFQTTLPVKLNNWWNMSYSFIGGWHRFKVDYTVQPATKTYLNWNVNFSQTFTLPKKFIVEVSGWCVSPFYNGSTKLGSMGALSSGIKKELKNNRGTIQLTVSDFLRSFQINSYYGTFAQEAFSIRNHVHINLESRVFPIFKLTYTKSFGTAMQSQRNQSAKDESDRIRKE